MSETKLIVISALIAAITGGIAGDCLRYYLKKRKEKKDKSSAGKENSKRDKE